VSAKTEPPWLDRRKGENDDGEAFYPAFSQFTGNKNGPYRYVVSQEERSGGGFVWIAECFDLIDEDDRGKRYDSAEEAMKACDECERCIIVDAMYGVDYE